MVSSGVYVYTPLIDQMAGICKVSVNDVADGVDIAYGKLKEGATLAISRQGVSGCANAAACKQTAACANQEEVRTKVCRLEVKLEDDVLCMVRHVDSEAPSNLQRSTRKSKQGDV
jgi:hypothetical protein